MQHDSLYGGRNIVEHPIHSGHDLLQLLKYGKIHGKKIFYTYCLMDDVLNFASTGASFYQDFTSKHAMHSNCNQYVRFAGEFHVIEQDGKHAIMIDNNSGTYAPAEENLPLAKRAFEENFPGLQVETVHWSDVKLKQYKQALESYNSNLLALRKQNKLRK